MTRTERRAQVPGASTERQVGIRRGLWSRRARRAVRSFPDIGGVGGVPRR